LLGGCFISSGAAFSFDELQVSRLWSLFWCT
jgi:hypothetical protein